MSILINLLPDVRQAKLRERRRKQMASGIAVMVWVICGGVVVLLSVYVAGQKVAINVLSGSIKDKESKLQSISGLPDALNAEEHLASLGNLYSKRVYMTKFFDAYQQADPQDAVLNSLTVDASNTMTVTGEAKTYADVAKLDRALAASNVQVGTNAKASNQPYFTNVNISSVNADSKGVGYTITAVMASGATGGGNGQ
ncbi:MAG TPA: PilN domain-containing protein [Candidatus Saccharimonadia bacterium]|jgi:Tfp pilus assembly protein PilN